MRRQRVRRSGAGGLVRLLPIVGFALYFGWYYLSNQQVVPLTERKQLVDLSHDQEMALGLQSYQDILSQSQVLTSGSEVSAVRQIGQRIAAAAADMDPGFRWEFNVINSNQANAFALPGGKVAVYTGILPIAENTNGLAIIMGHEVAHALARHGAERMARQKLLQIGSMAASFAIGDMNPSTQRAVLGALGVGAQYGVMLPFSRSHESEADYIGLVLAARACFDPREAPGLWERMGANAGKTPQEFMSTHPAPETRVQQFETWMPEALAIRAEYCQAR
ncbi:MAG: M48 family metallopeptidase [Pseudomonadota bacterium]